MNKTISVILATVLVIPANAIAQSSMVSGTIINTGDGDTLRANINGQPTTVRLTCVDAPEKKQSFGRQASERLKALLPKGQTVSVRPVNKDRYGRTVGEVYVNGQSINLQLVREGYAVVYREYINNCKATKSEYLQAEQQAKSQKLGLWAQSTVCLPKDYRRHKCS